jgi:hypothetical protein
MKSSYQFTADGMKAVSIPSEALKGINYIKPLNYSPLVK